MEVFTLHLIICSNFATLLRNTVLQDTTFIHCFMDGRDTDPKSGKGFIEQLTAHCAQSAGRIASIVGRFYAMDRDKRWERVKEAYDLLVNGRGKVATDMVQAMQDLTMKV